MSEAAGQTEFRCPHCGYDLRATQADPITDHLCCPECGRESSVAEIIRVNTDLANRLAGRWRAVLWPAFVLAPMSLVLMFMDAIGVSMSDAWSFVPCIIILGVVVAAPASLIAIVSREIGPSEPSGRRFGRTMGGAAVCLMLNVLVIMLCYVFCYTIVSIIIEGVGP